MISAFGVDHDGISKGLKPAHVKSMSRVMTGAAHSSSGFTGPGMQSGRAAQYSRARLAGNKAGAQKVAAKPGNRDPKGNPDYSPTSNGFKLANSPRAFKPVSKGLPSHLKAITPNVAVAPARKFRGLEPRTRDDYTHTRVRAHLAGKEAARKHGEWAKAPKDLSDGNIAAAEAKRPGVVLAAGKGRLNRQVSRQAVADNTPITRPKKIKS